MLINLPDVIILLLNVASIPGIHLAVSWLFVGLPPSFFQANGWWFRSYGWERGGQIYQTLFSIRAWKAWLPDGAAWFRGFSKKNLSLSDSEYLRRFVIETCRSEAAHYAQFVALLGLLAWNPWPVPALIILIYAAISNLPCILLQRFTRARIRRLLVARRGGRAVRTHPARLRRAARL